MKCSCVGTVGIPDPRTGGPSGLALKLTNPDCKVHGKHGKKKAKKEAANVGT
jgi:hypothetical protein